MNNIEQDSIFINKLTKVKKHQDDKIVYTLLPNYGKGSITMYPVLQGIYLTLNDLQFERYLSNTRHMNFSSPYIKIDYCLKGGYRFKFDNDMVGIVNKGNTIYYVGQNSFKDVYFRDDGSRSISIMCYLNEMIEPMQHLLGLSRKKVEAYCKKLSEQKEFLIIDTDIEVIGIMNEIYGYIKCDNKKYTGLIKLRVMELLFLEIMNADTYQNRRKKYYPRATIEKIERMKTFIEDNLHKHFTIEDLATKFSMSKTKLKGCFKHVYGVGPYTYLKNYRLEIASKLLDNSPYNILEIANMVGYASPSKFGVAFKEKYGVNPLKYKKMLE